MPNETLLYRTYPDEYIEYWGRVYLANPHLLASKVLFETFLISPREVLAAVMNPAPAVDGHAPLLPHQSRIRARMQTADHLRASLAGRVHG